MRCRGAAGDCFRRRGGAASVNENRFNTDDCATSKRPMSKQLQLIYTRCQGLAKVPAGSPDPSSASRRKPTGRTPSYSTSSSSSLYSGFSTTFENLVLGPSSPSSKKEAEEPCSTSAVHQAVQYQYSGSTTAVHPAVQQQYILTSHNPAHNLNYTPPATRLTG